MTTMDVESEQRPRQSAEAVTKSIRGKANSIEVQLKNARDLVTGVTNVYLPRKEEFVFEWLLERLKKDKNNLKSAQAQAELWELFTVVWKLDTLDSISRTSCSRKHNFVSILQDTFEDVKTRASPEQDIILANMDVALGLLLEGDSPIKLRPQLEHAIQLLGTCLVVVNGPEATAIEIADSLLTKIAKIFCSILYGDRPTKKVAKLFASGCLREALIFLTWENRSTNATEAIKNCVHKAMLSPDNFVDYLNALDDNNMPGKENAGFAALVQNLASTTSDAPFDDITAFPILLELCLKSLSGIPLSKLDNEQKSLLGSTFLSNLDNFSVSPSSPAPEKVPAVVHLSIRHLKRLSALLQVFRNYTPPPSDALSSTLATFATTCLSFLDFNDPSVPTYAWNVLSMIMQIDFDVVLGMMEQLSLRLQDASSTFLEVLVMTNFKIRNGVEFVKLWCGMVNAASEESKLCDDSLVKLISEEIKRNLSPSQLLELLKFMNEDMKEGRLLPLKAVIMGIKSKDTVEFVSEYIKEMFQKDLVKKLRLKSASEELYEIFYLLLELSDSLTLAMFDGRTIRRAAKFCEKGRAIYPVWPDYSELMKLQCILRLYEVCGPDNRTISKAIQKALWKTMRRLSEETESAQIIQPSSYTLMSLFVQRWIPLIRDFEGGPRACFVDSIFNLGARHELLLFDLYDPFLNYRGNSVDAHRYIALEHRFLMSSDLYEKPGLVVPLWHLLGSSLEAFVNSKLPYLEETDRQAHFMEHLKLARALHSLVLYSRLPLEPMSQEARRSLWFVMMQFQDGFMTQQWGLHSETKAFALKILRRTSLRFVSIVSNTSFENFTFISHLTALYAAIMKFDSDEELALLTMELGETILRRFAASTSDKATEFLNELVEKITSEVGDKMSDIASSFKTWLTEPTRLYFLPDIDVVFFVTIIEALEYNSERLNQSAQEKFNLTKDRFLRGMLECFQTMFRDGEMEKAAYQMNYLLKCCRRWLAKAPNPGDRTLTDTFSKDLKGFSDAFAAGIKICASEIMPQEIVLLVQESLKEILEIMMTLGTPEDPVVLSAFYINLVKYGEDRPGLNLTTGKVDVRKTCDKSFGKRIQTLESIDYDRLLEELSAAARTEVAASAALEVALDYVPEGRPYCGNCSPEGKDNIFVIAKLLFRLTRDLLRTSASECFAATLRIIQKILREKPKSVSRWNLDHLIANLTITCSPACQELTGSTTQDEVFEAIGAVALTILQLYHKRLTMKYHLIVRMLQVMVHVFVETTSVAPRKLKDTLSRPPPWLKDACSASSAQLFARILTMWATPPTATWQTTRESKRQLTSLAAKTGKAVSKHIPWFMMEYVALQAEYPELFMEESVQKALMPGIYTLFGVLGTYEREMCMAALDGPSRGVFKSLWEDWSKHGKYVET